MRSAPIIAFCVLAWCGTAEADPDEHFCVTQNEKCELVSSQSPCPLGGGLTQKQIMECNPNAAQWPTTDNLSLVPGSPRPAAIVVPYCSELPADSDDTIMCQGEDAAKVAIDDLKQRVTQTEDRLTQLEGLIKALLAYLPECSAESPKVPCIEREDK